MENFNQSGPAESYFERCQRLEREKRESLRPEIESSLGGSLKEFIIKKFSPREGKSDFPQLKELREKYSAVADRISTENIEADDLLDVEELIKNIGQYVGYWREKSRGDQEMTDEVMKFEVLKEELEKYLSRV